MANSTRKLGLTPKQVKCINMMLTPGFQKTVTEMCKELSIERSTYYDWLKNDTFKKTLSDGLSDLALHDLPEVWQSLINDCKDPKALGHTASMKIYFEMLGLYAQKINIGGIDKVIIAGADKLED